MRSEKPIWESEVNAEFGMRNAELKSGKNSILISDVGCGISDCRIKIRNQSIFWNLHIGLSFSRKMAIFNFPEPIRPSSIPSPFYTFPKSP
jgi:hypothetical protein